MAYRFTNTDKWNDAWFSELDWRQKVVFLYLCDQCDMAGFYEINLRKMAWDIAIDCADVEGALKGLKSRLLYSTNGKYLFIRNFLKHQKNLPLNEKNTAHRGIIRRLNEKLQLFNFLSIDDYFESPTKGASKGLQSPTGIGKGIGKDNCSTNLESSNEDSLSDGVPPDAQKPKPKGKKEKIDYERLITWFNDQTKGVFGNVKYPISEKRKSMVRARINEHGKEMFMAVVKMACESDFLRGQNKSGFIATFDWIIKPSNFDKILSGNYSNKSKPNEQEQQVFDI